VLLLTTIALPAIGANLRDGAEPHYAIVERIGARAALWDYVTVNAEPHRLYVGQAGSLLSYDLALHRVLPTVVTDGFVHGVALLGSSGRMATSNGFAKTVSIVDQRTDRLLATIRLHEAPDAIAFEPDTGLIVATTPEAGAIQLIDPQGLKPVGAVQLRGRPEYIAANGHGVVFGNIYDKNAVAVIDVRRKKVVRTFELPGCISPTGMAFDPTNLLVISVCENGALLFLDAETGAVRKALKVGGGADAVIFDPVRSVVLVPTAEDGILNIIRLKDSHDIRVAQRLATRPGTRTGAVDILTGRVYLPAGDVLPATQSERLPTIKPGTFRILVAAPQ
jgi:DNA-binding beta-propeller fold protein YncE